MKIFSRLCPECNGKGRFAPDKVCETCNATGTMTDAAYIDALTTRIRQLEAERVTVQELKLQLAEAVFNAYDIHVPERARLTAVYLAALEAAGYDKSWTNQLVSTFIEHLRTVVRTARLSRGQQGAVCQSKI